MKLPLIFVKKCHWVADAERAAPAIGNNGNFSYLAIRRIANGAATSTWHVGVVRGAIGLIARGTPLIMALA